jgi:hypothetical protein
MKMNALDSNTMYDLLLRLPRTEKPSIREGQMDANRAKRKNAIFCPQCGRMVGKARTCDIEFQCQRCHYKFEAVIGPYADKVCDRGQPTNDGESEV